MIRGVIFDLDGTTIYTLEDIHVNLVRALEKHGYPACTIDDTRRGVGNGFVRLLKAVLPKDTDDDDVMRIAQDYKSIYSENLCVYSHPYEGMRELMKKLQSKGIKIGVNSNKSDANTKKLIHECFPDCEFTWIVGAKEGMNNKPDPQGALEIAEKMGLTSVEMAYIGDSETDMATAKNARMFSVACLWGYRDRDVLMACGPDLVVETPDQLIDFF